LNEIKILGGLPGHKRKGGGFQTGYSVYGADGISTGVAVAWGGGYVPMIVENKIKQIGNLAEKQGGRKNPSCGRIYDTDGISPALNTMQGGGRDPHIVAMRGRETNSREKGLATEQRLEMKMDGTSNTLTTVQKDNLVLENKPEAGELV
jgi:DNA (cytosine-5)-methyltransferase 1